MKRRIIRASEDRSKTVLLSSDMFELVEVNGIGRNNTPFTLKEVVSKGLAKKWVVSIHMDSRGFYDFEGDPVVYSYRGCYINYGLRMKVDTHIEEYIKVLNAAVDFKNKIDEMYGFKTHYLG